MNKTTILIKKETRELLKRVGTKNETYDDIISKLILKKGSGLTIH
jgi:hypothetical protein